MTIFLTITFYSASVIAGYAVEIVFALAHLIPGERDALVQMAHLSWNYTTFLNIAFLLLAAGLIVRFLPTGGMAMMAMMHGGPDDMAGHDHAGHHHGDHDGDDHAGLPHHVDQEPTSHEHTGHSPGADHGPGQ